MEYSFVLPCKDEEKTIGLCINKIKKELPAAEIIVVDNNSRDDSVKIAKSKGVKVIKEKKQGYGYALRKGFNEAKGEYVIFGDADDTYDYREIPKLIKHRKKYDLVMGNRRNSLQRKKSMPTLHKYVGTPSINFILKIFFGVKVTDSQCGFRLIKKEKLDALKLKSGGMELASEMLIKAKHNNYSIKEVDISYHPRIGESKLDTFRDGWRHLRLMLIYSPSSLFLIPGIVLTILGLAILLILSLGPVTILDVTLDLHPLILGSLLTITGYQIIVTWVFSKFYGKTELGTKDKAMDFLERNMSLDSSLIISLLAIITGLLLNLFIFLEWIAKDFGELERIRMGIIALTITALGVQTLFSSFFIAILKGGGEAHE